MSRPRGMAGQVRLVATQGPLKPGGVGLYLTSPPQVSGGVGGWEATDRPGRRPARWWRGGQELTQTLEGVIFSDERAAGTVEPRLEVLRKLGTTPAGQEHPTPLRLRGDAIDSYSARGGLWVMQNLALGDRVFRRNGTLRWQQVTVELVDFDDAPTIRPVSVRRTRSSVAKPRVRTITTRKGDTLRAIGVRELGSASSWQRIREWNAKAFGGTRPIGPDDPLRAGVKVVLK